MGGDPPTAAGAQEVDVGVEREAGELAGREVVASPDRIAAEPPTDMGPLGGEGEDLAEAVAELAGSLNVVTARLVDVIGRVIEQRVWEMGLRITNRWGRTLGRAPNPPAGPPPPGHWQHPTGEPYDPACLHFTKQAA